jgi:hypothetical protein
MNWALSQNVKVQALESFKDFFKHRDSSRLHFGHNGLYILGVSMGFQNFVTHILNEVLF